MTWIERLAKAVGQRPDLFPKGEVSHSDIRHDDWCRKLVQGGFCDCDPDIWFVADGTAYAVTPQGNVVHR